MRYKIIKLKKVDSTHKFALRMIENGSAFECGILADVQTNGVGRCERKWESAQGNLYSSILMQLPSNKDVCKISLATACAVHKSIEKFFDTNGHTQERENLYLHWPNDVYYKNKKLSGILIAVVEGWIVISVGINIHSVSTPTAVSFDDIFGNPEISAERLFESVLNELYDQLNSLRVDGFSCVKEYWLRHMVGIDSSAIIRNGDDSLSGIIRGIDELGRLILEKCGKNLYVSSGDMFINEKKILVSHE